MMRLALYAGISRFLKKWMATVSDRDDETRRDETRRDAVDIELWFAFKKDLGLLDLEQIYLFPWYLTLTE